ncbi:hypothetical protein [Chryseobacterium sp. SIMBA_038]|uniref:hypothetical protein n=1 Tax=Chryseobacterium sp. SIMBA_038 TaxID=3085780 RepID=UPI00397BBDA2
MKKTIKMMSIGLGIVSSTLYAQNDINFGDFSNPVPSVSSLATYSNAPQSNASGIPSITLPLLTLPTSNSSVSLNTGLSYNPMNTSESEPASQVGNGWSLFAGGVISRSIVGDIDEVFDNAGSSNYTKNDYNDIYYYSLPGASGKLKFKRNIQNNTFELVNLSSNKVRINYVPESNNATLIIKSFTITDTKGIQYIFNDYTRSNKNTTNYIPGGKIYKSAFFLTQIKDANNIELANFSYQKDIKYKSNGSTLLYETCKLKTITSPGYGKIEFDNVYESSMEGTMNDPYKVNKVILKDNYNHIISGYSFEYVNAFNRTLDKLKKLNRNSIATETTAFEYSTVSYDSPSYYGIDLSSLCPGYATTLPNNPGVLKRVINPSGGVVEYNFEHHQVYFNRADPAYLNSIMDGDNYVDSAVQYLEPISDILYDTNHATEYSFTVSGTKPRKIFIAFGYDELFTPPLYWDTNTPPYVDYLVNDGGQFLFGTTCGANTITREFFLSPGTYKLRITGSGGRGLAHVFQIAHLPLPLKNTAQIGGVRIANIKYYNSKTDTTPIKTTKFEYNSFSDSNTSSGYAFSPEIDMNGSTYILYKNVKITNTDDGNGYVKYYYKTPDDYPQVPYTVDGVSKMYWPYYAFTSGGLLDKKEVYDAQNKLLALEKSEYTFADIPGTADYSAFEDIYSKLGWLKKIVNTSTSYFENNQSLEEQAETNFSEYNFEMSSTKKISDGSIIEQFYTYPETGYSNLSSAHIMSVPVVIQEKNDGKLVSKTETKFDNPSSTFPTSVVTSNIDDNSTKAITINQYDDRGNIVQFTSAVGIPSAVVYGYDKTKPLAKIEGATYAQVSSLIQPIIDASNADAADPSKEGLLLIALDNFRKLDPLKSFQITTYTYDPLIGSTTATQPNGIREIYKYDTSNRLERVIDMNGVTLKEYKYNYKN